MQTSTVTLGDGKGTAHSPSLHIHAEAIITEAIKVCVSKVHLHGASVGNMKFLTLAPLQQKGVSRAGLSASFEARATMSPLPRGDPWFSGCGPQHQQRQHHLSEWQTVLGQD